MPAQTGYAAHMYIKSFAQFRKQLGQLDKWLVTASEYAKSRNFDPDVFLTLRLAPDQFALVRQVQIACDTLKLAVAYLTGNQCILGLIGVSVFFVISGYLVTERWCRSPYTRRSAMSTRRWRPWSCSTVRATRRE